MTLPALITEVEKLENFTTKQNVLSKLKSAHALLEQAGIDLTEPEPTFEETLHDLPITKPAVERVAANSMGKTKLPEAMPVGG